MIHFHLKILKRRCNRVQSEAFKVIFVVIKSLVMLTYVIL